MSSSWWSSRATRVTFWSVFEKIGHGQILISRRALFKPHKTCIWATYLWLLQCALYICYLYKCSNFICVNIFLILTWGCYKDVKCYLNIYSLFCIFALCMYCLNSWECCFWLPICMSNRIPLESSWKDDLDYSSFVEFWNLTSELC